jgi:TonB family protein
MRAWGVKWSGGAGTLMRLDERLPDRGPGAPVRPGNDLARLLTLIGALAAIAAIWAVVMLVQSALEPPPNDPRLANNLAQSVESPATWVTPDDYPPSARRRNEEGAVGVAFTVDVWGRATRCTVTTSSNSDALDEATCALIERRARYTPARDAAGRAVESSKTLRFRWMLED